MARYIPGKSEVAYAPPIKKTPSKGKPKPAPAPVRSEISTGLVQKPKKKEQPQQGPAPEIQAGLPSLTGPPIPVLQKHGNFGSIHDVNQQVQDISDAYQEKFGHLPSPGLTWDLLRQNVKDPHQLFGVLPTSSSQAQAFNALGAVPGRPRPKLADPSEQFLADMKAAAEAGNLADFEDAHADELNQYLQDTRTHGKVQAILSLVPGATSGSKGVRAAGLDIQQGKLFATGGAAAAGVIALGVAQVSSALVHTPQGIYTLGKSLGLDTKEVLPPELGGAPRGQAPFHRTTEIAKQTAEGFKRDVQHPEQNPGFLFLDVLGLVGGASGTVTRVGRAGAALRAGEGAGAAAKALIQRPVGGTYDLKWGDVTANELQSENRAVAFLQRRLAARRNRAVELRRNGKDSYPAGTLAVTTPTVAQDILDKMFNPFRKTFSTEAKIGRVRAASSRIDQTVAMTAARELEHASGWSTRASRTFKRPTGKALKRGEQKAIQVLSTDVPGGPMAQVAAHKAFHEWAKDAGVGDAAAHSRQLSDLKLAAKALENPSKRLQKAIDLTRAVMEDGQRIKINDLGLNPFDAEARIVAAGSVFKNPEVGRVSGVVEPRATEESFYLPFVNRAHTRNRTASSANFASPRPGPYGIPIPAGLPELNHFFTGDSIYAGDFRIDATNLATESYARTVKASAITHTWRQLWDSALDTKPSGPERQFYRPIRDARQIKDEVKGALNPILEQMPHKKEAGLLTEKEHQALLENLYPEETTLTRDQLGDIKWVDERLISDMRQMPDNRAYGKKAMSVVNEPLRDLILYTPHYILNAVGNTGMGLIHQGPLLPMNIVRAVYKKQIYGEENARTITALVGEGKSKSFISPDTTFAPGRNLAQAWSFVTDKFFREGALIHEMRRQGIKTAEQAKDWLNKEEFRNQRNEATLRANKAMVQFDNLTWFEKNSLRHYIFVYPWVSRSLVWNVRTMIEHPIQVALLAKIGEEAEASMDQNPIFSQSPEWFKRTGYIPVGWTKDGKPKVVNPTSVNNFSTLGEMVDIFRAGVKGDPYARVADLLGPAAQVTVHGVTGRDNFGNDYPGSQWWGAAKEQLLGTPEAKLFGTGKQKTQKLPPFDVTDRESLVKNEHLLATKKYATVLGPGYWDGMGTLMSGGFTPKVYDPEASASRYWATQPYEARHKHEMGLVRQALQIQGVLLREGVPKEVNEAVTLGGQKTAAYHNWSQEKGRTPGPVERFHIDLQVLLKANRINQEDAAHMRELMKKANEPSEISAVRTALNDKYAGAKQLRQWDEDVRFVYSFRPHILKERFDTLSKQGLIIHDKVPKDQKTLFQFGRQMLGYRRDLKKLTEESKSPHLTSAEKSLKMQDIRDWEDAHDVPTKVGSHTFPSPVRMNWSLLTPEARRNAVYGNTTKSWHLLTNFDKEILGKKVDKRIGTGWKTLAFYRAVLTGKVQAQGMKPLPPGERSISKEYENILAKWVEKQGDDGKPVPGFYKDYLFAKEPLYRRMSTFEPIQKSPNRKLWTEVFTAANAMHKYTKNDAYSKSAIHDTWTGYVESTVMPYVESHPTFYKELQRYGSSPQDFLNGLIS